MRYRSLQGLVLLSAPLQASCGGEGLRVRTEQNSNYAGLRESPPVTSPATPKVVIIGVATSVILPPGCAKLATRPRPTDRWQRRRRWEWCCSPVAWDELPSKF